MREKHLLQQAAMNEEFTAAAAAADHGTARVTHTPRSVGNSWAQS